MYRFFNWGELNVSDALNANMNPKIFNFNDFET